MFPYPAIPRYYWQAFFHRFPAKTFPQQQRSDITAPRWEDQSSPHVGQGGPLRFGPTSRTGLPGSWRAQRQQYQELCDWRARGRLKEGKQRPHGLWKWKNESVYIAVSRKCPLFVKAGRHGYTVLPRAWISLYRVKGFLYLHMNEGFTPCPPPPGFYLHDSMLGSHHLPAEDTRAPGPDWPTVAQDP